MNFLSELLFLKKKQNNFKFVIVNFLLQNKYCYNQFIFEKDKHVYFFTFPFSYQGNCLMVHIVTQHSVPTYITCLEHYHAI